MTARSHPSATALAITVGGRVREARTLRDLSLGELARRAGVGKASLSELENGARNPTLSTLYALAAALQVPLATLLADRSGSEVASPGITARLLEAEHAEDGGTVETYVLTLTPGHRHRSPGHGPGVEEHVYLTRGRARVGRTGEQVEIAAGESATWVSDVEHGYEALDGSPARAVLVIRTPGR